MKKRVLLMMAIKCPLFLFNACGEVGTPVDSPSGQNPAGSTDHSASSDKHEDDDSASEQDISGDTDDDAKSEETGCRNGFTGSNCDECTQGHAGDKCAPVTCKNGQADEGRTGTGHCLSCNGEWAGLDCDIKNTCIHGEANIGIDGDGHCIKDSCQARFSGEDCSQCKNPNVTGENCDRCKDVAPEGTMNDMACNNYKTKVINRQLWMAENMRYVPDSNKYRHADGNAQNDGVFGLLYDFETAQTICPPDWRLPTDSEYHQLGSIARTYYDNEVLAMIAKSPEWKNDKYNNKGNNAVGFGGLPAGYCDRYFCKEIGYQGRWWTGTVKDADHAQHFHIDPDRISNYSDTMYRIKTDFLSVRCLYDPVCDDGTVRCENNYGESCENGKWDRLTGKSCVLGETECQVKGEDIVCVTPVITATGCRTQYLDANNQKAYGRIVYGEGESSVDYDGRLVCGSADVPVIDWDKISHGVVNSEAGIDNEFVSVLPAGLKHGDYCIYQFRNKETQNWFYCPSNQYEYQVPKLVSDVKLNNAVSWVY